MKNFERLKVAGKENKIRGSRDSRFQGPINTGDLRLAA
jgi:hypothetical protein